MCDRPHIVKMEELRLLVGRKAMAKYCQVYHDTISRWTRDFGFPACPRPDGRRCTSVFLIDAWLQARTNAYQERFREIDDAKAKASADQAAERADAAEVDA